MAAGGFEEATSEILDYTRSNAKWTQIANLPSNRYEFLGARAVTSPSGQGVIVQASDNLYELNCDISGCSWTTLPQKLKKGVCFATLLALPPGTGCN